MDIFQWIISFLGQNASELADQARNLEVNNSLFIPYVALSLLIKRASFMASFFMSCMLFEASVFDQLSEADLYLLTFAIYSYVTLDKALTLKQRLACGILLILSLLLAYDAYFYGIDGLYGASETVIYNNIESLALCAHTIFISTFISYRRINNSIRRFIDSVLLISRNSAYIVVC